MISKHLRRMAAIALASNLVLAMPNGLFAAPGPGNDASESGHTTTPIKHVIVIFGENESFDHYFGTYPHATNPKGEPFFEAKAAVYSPRIRTPPSLSAWTPACSRSPATRTTAIHQNNKRLTRA
jgi:phospholipase C